MPTYHVSVRLDTAMMARVDALGPQFSTKWRTASRSDILRGLILDALERFEKPAREGASSAQTASPTASSTLTPRRRASRSRPRRWRSSKSA